ncbi:MAG TPA: STAS domain-containing protein [Candidatus Angelobacter sp.]
MLNVTVQKLSDVSILHCRGRILFGDTNLHNAALSQKDSGALVLDLAQVDGIDAGGLGVLLDLRTWALAHGNELKLLNVMPAVQQVLESTHLNLIFEVCSVREMFHLLCRAHGVDAALGRPTDRSNTRERELNSGDELQPTRN